VKYDFCVKFNDCPAQHLYCELALP